MSRGPRLNPMQRERLIADGVIWQGTLTELARKYGVTIGAVKYLLSTRVGLDIGPKARAQRRRLRLEEREEPSDDTQG